MNGEVTVQPVTSHIPFCADRLRASCESERSEPTKVRQIKGRWGATG